jgi:hypothetical protein
LTFQVSDINLTDKRRRRVARHQALLSYLFGAGIVAITVSSAAALLGRQGGLGERPTPPHLAIVIRVSS